MKSRVAVGAVERQRVVHGVAAGVVGVTNDGHRGVTWLALQRGGELAEHPLRAWD